MSEHYINSVEDYLIDGLSFKMPAGGSYVISRKNVLFILQEVLLTQVFQEPN